MADKPISVSKQTKNALAAIATMLPNIDKTLKQINGDFEEIDKGAEELAKNLKLADKDAKELSKEFKVLDKSAASFEKSMVDAVSEGMNPNKAAVLVDKFKRLSSIQKEMARLEKTGGPGSFEARVEKAKEMKKLQEGIASDQKRAQISLKSAAGGFIKDFSSAPDILSGVGKGLVGLGKLGISSLGKFAGPVGIAATAIKAIWDMGMAADEFVKNANKSFAMVRGPDLMTTDVEKQFKDFNNQVYNVGENLRAGLNASQVLGFMEALTSAGTHLDKIKGKMGDYREAVYSAAKASAVMGVSLPAVGTYMSELINNIKLNTDKMDDTFIQIAFDAQKAGLSTDTFWRAVDSASSSLSLYGVFINKTSQAMAAYTKTGAMGVSETAGLVQDLTQSFSKMGDEGRMAIAGLAMTSEAGRKTLVAYYEEAKKGFEETAKSAKATPEQKGVARTQAGIAGQLIKAIQSGDKNAAIMLAPQLSMISDGTADVFSAILKEQGIMKEGWAGVDLTNTLLIKKIASALKISEESAMALIRLAHDTDNTLKDQLGLTSDDNKSIIKTLAANADTITDNIADDTTAADNAFVRQLEDKLDENHKEQLKKMISLDKSGQFIKTLRKNFNAEKQMAKGDISIYKKELEAANFTGDMANNLVNNNTEQTKITDDMRSTADKQFEDIRDQTLSFTDMQKMAEDGAKWTIYQGGWLQGINQSAADILKVMLKTERSPSQKEADKNLATIASGDPGLKKYIKGGVVSQEGLSEMAKKTFELSKKRDAYDKMVDKNSPEAKDLEKQINALLEMRTYLNQSDSHLISIQTLLEKSEDKADPEGAKKASENLAKELTRMADQEEKNFWLKPATKTDEAEKYGIKVSWWDKLKSEISGNIIGASRATLNKPEIVMSGGPVKLDPGESILPKEYSKFRTVPALGNFGPTGNTPGGGGKGALSITFNALGLTEKNLAQRVLNEIRAAMYREKLTNAA